MTSTVPKLLSRLSGQPYRYRTYRRPYGPSPANAPPACKSPLRSKGDAFSWTSAAPLNQAACRPRTGLPVHAGTLMWLVDAPKLVLAGPIFRRGALNGRYCNITHRCESYIGDHNSAPLRPWQRSPQTSFLHNDGPSASARRAGTGGYRTAALRDGLTPMPFI